MIASEATIWLGYAALAAGLVLAYVCSGVETGTYVLNKIRLDLQAESGNRQALRLRGLLQRPEETLTVLLVMSNIANYVASAALVVVLTHSGRLKHYFLAVREIFGSATFSINSHSLLFLHGWDLAPMAFLHPVMDLLKPSRLFRDIQHLGFL